MSGFDLTPPLDPLLEWNWTHICLHNFAIFADIVMVEDFLLWQLGVTTHHHLEYLISRKV